MSVSCVLLTLAFTLKHDTTETNTTSQLLGEIANLYLCLSNRDELFADEQIEVVFLQWFIKWMTASFPPETVTDQMKSFVGDFMNSMRKRKRFDNCSENLHRQVAGFVSSIRQIYFAPF